MANSRNWSQNTDFDPNNSSGHTDSKVLTNENLNLFNSGNVRFIELREKNHFKMNGKELNDCDYDDDVESDYSEKHPLISPSGINYELKQRSQNQSQHQKRSEQPNISLHQTQRNNYVLYTIRPGDTLLSISLACHCSLEELKRLNGLMNEREFFGLRYLKIPARKYGIFTQALQGNGQILILNSNDKFIPNSLITSNNTLVSDLNSNQPLVSLDEQDVNETSKTDCSALNLIDNKKVFNGIGAAISENCNQTGSPIPGQAASLVIDVVSGHNFESITSIDQKLSVDPKSFLNSLDENLEQIRKQNGLATKTLPSDIRAHLKDEFNSQSIQTGVQQKSILNCDGADCGLSWTSVVCIALFVCVIGPLIYTLIWAEERLAENQLHQHLGE